MITPYPTDQHKNGVEITAEERELLWCVLRDSGARAMPGDTDAFVAESVIKDIVYAHMWWNLASANVDNHAVKNREIAETRMTSAQIAEAQKLARECVRKKYKGC